MIRKILYYYAYCDSCGKQFKVRNTRVTCGQKEMLVKLAEKGWTVIDGMGVFCPNCVKKISKNIS